MESVGNFGLSKVRIVLIGGRELGGINASGKSSSGNMILGRNVFQVGRRTACSVQGEGEVFGRHVTVVDTPGWWWHYPAELTPRWDRAEIMRSLSLCFPGPHALLLVIPVDSVFPYFYKTSLEEHIEFLGGGVWRHTIVVFSSVAPHDSDTFQKHIKQWPDLQWLIKKCHNRYHILDIRNRGNGLQVSSLLDKIDEMALRPNAYFQVDENFVIKLEETKQNNEKKAQQRTAEIQRQRNHLRAQGGVTSLSEMRVVIVGTSLTAGSSAETPSLVQMCLRLIRKEQQSAVQLPKPRLMGGGSASSAHQAGKNFRLPHLRIVLLGQKEAGKSCLGNNILNDLVFELVQSEESKTRTSTQKSMAQQKEIAGRLVTAVDTPGWSETSPQNVEEILHSVSLCPPGPHAFLLVVSAKSSFTKKDQAAVEHLMKLFDESIWRHTLVLFSWGEWLGSRAIEEHIECEGEPLKWLLEKCGNRYHVLDSFKWDDGTKVRLLLEKIEEMVVRNRGNHFSIEKKKKPKTVRQWLAGLRMMTEEEWNEREDDLVDRMLKAVAVDLEVEDSTLPLRRRMSFDIAYIPSLSGETPSELGSFAGGGRYGRLNVKVVEWLRNRPDADAASSGYDTMSNASTTAEMERV